MGNMLTYEQLGRINAKWFAILKQMHQRGGYPYDPEHLEKTLQMLFEGKFPFDVTDPLFKEAATSNILLWAPVYRALGMEKEYSEFEYDVRPDLWTVPVLACVTPSRVIKAFRNLGVDVYCYYNDIDAATPTNDRDPKRDGSYSASFKKNIEADPEFAGKSAKDLEKAGVKGITLLERLLLELAYFMQTNAHLDVQNVTLCSGSRDSDGDVPRVDWYADDRKLCVGWYGMSSSSSDIRARAEVS